MTEYIEREAALDALCKASVPCFSATGKPILDVDYVPAIVSIPAADVKPVVRCGECIHGYDDIGGRYCSYGVCVDCVVTDDFYCADGERGDNNDR